MICGIIDIGSNTIRLSIYRYENQSVQLLLHRKTMAGLASYVKKGELPSAGVRVLCNVLTEYQILLKNLDIASCYAFATASLRNISNTESVVGQVFEETGIHVDVISGEDEARLSFRGALQGMNYKSGLMVDLGGGSTELLWYKNCEVISAYSLSIGSLNLFDRYVTRLHPTETECKMIQKEVGRQLIQRDVEICRVDHICGVGGTARAACKTANEFFHRPDDCRKLSSDELKILVKKFKKMDGDTMRTLLKIVPDRIHTIVPGVLVLDALCKSCGAKDITVSACGVREGYLHQRVIEEN